jgi:hypothetical protein
MSATKAADHRRLTGCMVAASGQALGQYKAARGLTGPGASASSRRARWLLLVSACETVRRSVVNVKRQ